MVDEKTGLWLPATFARPVKQPHGPTYRFAKTTQLLLEPLYRHKQKLVDEFLDNPLQQTYLVSFIEDVDRIIVEALS
jgi:hypothetical protein